MLFVTAQKIIQKLFELELELEIFSKIPAIEIQIIYSYSKASESTLEKVILDLNENGERMVLLRMLDDLRKSFSLELNDFNY